MAVSNIRRHYVSIEIHIDYGAVGEIPRKLESLQGYLYIDIQMRSNVFL